ncbi:hypothetical protein QFC21_002876 [Naganishia friedmannii]|uniref:Uncharacterized protein n=1 Tax=Naganishia friedmannii TaxID=89922 RepID=A0ACC2VV66_9TREE|nr:hypothetical protein QFC21_002876 [Naganishia friedmannii]
MIRRNLAPITRQVVQTRHYSPSPSAVLAALPTRPGGPRISRSSRPDRRPSKSGSEPDPDSASGSHRYERPQQPFQSSYPFMNNQPGFDSPGHSMASQIPVHIPTDPNGVLRETDGAVSLLANSALVIVRQLEMLNVFMGFEQANKYAILNPQGEHVGYMAEEDQGFMSVMMRQALRTHRPFRSVVMDKHGTPVLWIRRPFAFINSKIFVHAEQEETGGNSRLVGEAQHREETFKQFARIDSGFWAWDFWLKDADDRQYVIRFDAVEQELALKQADNSANPNQAAPSLVIPPSATDLTLDERAMALATAVTIDIDYFSRHSGSGGMGFPFFMWGGGVGDEYGRGSSDGGVGVGGAVGAGVGVQEGMQEGMYPEEEIYPEEVGPDIGLGDDFEDPF